MELRLSRIDVVELIEAGIATRFPGPWKVDNTYEVPSGVTVALADEAYLAEQARVEAELAKLRSITSVAAVANEALAA